jgi:hypothetical protein
MMFASTLGRLPGLRTIWGEADVLEARYGREAALRVVLKRIATADRSARRRLYLLHDEISRRAIHEPAV